MSIVIKTIGTLLTSILGLGFIIIVGTPHKSLFLPSGVPYEWSYGRLEIGVQGMMLIATILIVVCIWRMPR